MGEADSGPDARPRPRYADAGGLTDGALVLRDAEARPRDADVLTEAGVCRTGSASGLACTPRGDTPIPHAQVTALTRDCSGARVERVVETNELGFFRLEDLAPGPTEVTLRSGNFVARYVVTVVAQVDVPVAGGVSNKVCLEADAARLAVVTGDYDEVQGVLADLGFDYDLFCGDHRDHRAARRLFLDRELLFSYDIVFLNCGSGIDLRAKNPEIREMLVNLRDFVAGGGSVYVSDLAADWVAQAWPGYAVLSLSARQPEDAPPCCVCGDCPPTCAGPVGPATERCPDPSDLPAECRRGAGVSGGGNAGPVRARVLADFLRSALGADALEVEYDLGGWVEIRHVEDQVAVLVEGGADRPGEPLMILFQPQTGGGRVAYTTFHQHAQTTDPMRRILAALVLRL